MRMSCNGCRVLRKGCSETCSIRPCLQWIKSAEAQGNATVFLAKFYGRAGLMNLIAAGPDHLRPAIFRSLLYEACGRIVNPIYGSVGLLWSGSWQLCQSAVEAVLKGAPITPIDSDVAVTSDGPPLKAYDIRHVSKGEISAAAAADEQRHQVKAQRRIKRRADPAKKPCTGAAEEVVRSPSHESSLSHQSVANVDGDSKDVESMVSEETTAGESAAERAEERGGAGLSVEGGEVGLELTLGLETAARVNHTVPVKKRRFDDRGLTDRGACKMELGL